MMVYKIATSVFLVSATLSVVFCPLALIYPYSRVWSALGRVSFSLTIAGFIAMMMIGIWLL